MKSLIACIRRLSLGFVSIALVSTLTACGGGGGAAGTPIIGGSSGSTAAVADLTLQIDKTSVPNTGAEKVTLTVTSIDANRNVVGNVPVYFSVDNGGVLTPSGSSTDKTSGVVTATVGIGSDYTNRKLTIVVATGSITRTVSFNVVDSVTGGQVADMALVLDRTTIPNDGSQNVKLTVTTLDTNRAAAGNSPVTIKVNDVDVGGAFVNTNGAKSTDALTGQLTATVGLGTVKTNRSITLVVTSGTVQRSVSFNVIDAVVSIPKAADLTMALDKLSIGDAGQELVTATVVAVDSKRNVISGIPVSFSVNNNAIVQTSAAQTDSTGTITATVRIGADKSNRLITVTATSDTLVRTATFQVTGAKVQATAVPQQPVAGSTGNTITYRVIDVNSSAMAFVPISVSAPGLATATGTTDANGSYTYAYTAPSVPGAIDVTASASGVSNLTTVTVTSGSSSVPVVTAIVSSPSLTAAPNVVAVNVPGSTTNQTQIKALFQTGTNAPVQNIRVRFDQAGDLNSIGGKIAAGNDIVYSDALGAAVTSYAPAQRASPTGGVTIRACWDYADFASSACPNSIITTLTVVSDPLSITIGTDNTIADGPSKLTYVKKYVLLVVDAAGNPKSDVQISPSIDLGQYAKGYYTWDLATAAWKKQSTVTCQNEDVNRNGLIDTGEDLNGNKQLDPRKSDVSISMVGTTKTDANGTAVLQIEYPKSLGSWVTFRISAAATGVLSPPAYFPVNIADPLNPGASYWLPVSSEEIKTQSPEPSFARSPYGQSSSCFDTN